MDNTGSMKYLYSSSFCQIKIILNQLLVDLKNVLFVLFKIISKMQIVVNLSGCRSIIIIIIIIENYRSDVSSFKVTARTLYKSIVALLERHALQFATLTPTVYNYCDASDPYTVHYVCLHCRARG